MPKRFLSLTASLAFVHPAFAQEKVTYVDHVRPLLENKCFSCHNPDKKKGGLDLTSFAGAMSGGGSGAVINSGNPDGSKIIDSLTRKAEPYMPPEGAPFSAKEIGVIVRWIQGGVLEIKSSLSKKGAPRANIALATAPKGRPEGPPLMPENVLLEPVVLAPRSTAVTALAASPWAPLVAISGMKQALVYDANTKVLAGVYPYPEGFIRSLKFSQNGALLIAGGGRGGKAGNAVVWDVKTGRRVMEAGHEFDQVMCADISPSHRMIVIGSPSKKVKCYSANTGEELYIIKKHAEWILNVAFSPDGVLLASADRNGGIIISEAETGGEFYLLEGHKAACTGLSWRNDSNVLASCSEDGKVALWEMQNGKLVKNWDAHGGGVLSVAFMTDGDLVTSGRDGIIRVWDVNGKKLSESKAQGDLVTKVAALSERKIVVSGDWQGNVKLWSADKFDAIETFSSNPLPITQRIADSERMASEILTLVSKVEKEVKDAMGAVKSKEALVVDTKKKAAEAQACKLKLEAELVAFPEQIDALKKIAGETQAKLQAQAKLIRKNEQAVVQMKQIELKIVKLEGEYQACIAESATLAAPDQSSKKTEVEQKAGRKKGELDVQRGRLDDMKKVAENASQPLSDFDGQLKAANDKITVMRNAKPEREKELGRVKKSLEGWPKQIADAEKQLVESTAAVAVVQQKLEGVRSRLVWAQRYPAFLKAAQFNVNVIAEKEKLEKLDSELGGLKDGLKEAEAARVLAAERIATAKKHVAEAAIKLPALDAVFIKLKGELSTLEEIIQPTKAEEARLVSQVDVRKKIIADNEVAQKNLEQEKSKRITVAQNAVDEINKQIAALQKQAGEVNAKATDPIKNVDAKLAALAKAETELNGAKQKQAGATKVTQQFETEVKARQSAQPQDVNAVTAANSALTDARAAGKQADLGVQTAQGVVKGARGMADAAEMAAAPLRAHQQNIAGQIERQKVSLIEKQAEVGNAEKDFAGKSEPVQALIAAAKAALGPFETKLADVRAKLAAGTKTVGAKQVEVAKVQANIADAKKAWVDAQKTIENSMREIADKTIAIAEGKADLSKLERQITPQRDTVMKLSDQYLALLPK